METCAASTRLMLRCPVAASVVAEALSLSGQTVGYATARALHMPKKAFSPHESSGRKRAKVLRQLMRQPANGWWVGGGGEEWLGMR